MDDGTEAFSIPTVKFETSNDAELNAVYLGITHLSIPMHSRVTVFSDNITAVA